MSKKTKCDTCLTASFGICRLSPATCGESYMADTHISLSSGEVYGRI